MGLAASQARLLFLTSRLSDLELRAEVISNAKIRLAMESSTASEEYTAALDKQKFQVQNGFSSGSPTYTDATALNLTSYDPSQKQRFIENQSGQVLVSDAVKQAYNNAHGNVTTFVSSMVSSNSSNNSSNSLNSYDTAQNAASSLQGLDAYSGALAPKGSDACKQLNSYLDQIWNGLNSKLSDPSLSKQTIADITTAQGYIRGIQESLDLNGETAQNQALLQGLCTGTLGAAFKGNSTTIKQDFSTGNLTNVFSEITTDTGKQYADGESQYYANLFNQIQANGGCWTTSDDNMKDPNWLDSQVNAGSIFLYEQQKQPDGTDPFANVSWTSGDPTIQEVDDSTETAKAEAKYESTTAQIQVKDKIYDLDLKNIDTEHNSTQTEIDSVKKLIDKNIERSFKMFQA